MRQRQILVCESEDRLAELLRPRAQANGWRLTEVRHPRVCLGLLPHGGDSVFVLRIGRDVVREMTLLAQVVTLFPETAAVVVCDADNVAIVNLAWDLGARFVLPPTETAELLPDIVAGFLGAGSDAGGGTEP